MLALIVIAPISGIADEKPATTITRDQWGVAHIRGTTHADAFYGMGYAQAEDYFWQLEDTCIRSLGRYAEVVGDEGIRSDILNRSFQIAERSKDDFEKLNPQYQDMAAAFTDGINHFLKTHPDEKPRLIKKFEPWYVIAMDRHMLLHFIYRRSHIGKPRNRSGADFAQNDGSILSRPAGEIQHDNTTRQPKTGFAAWELPRETESPFAETVRASIGSNAWAIAGSKTKSGAAMLFINPHQPWYGMGQFYEAHVRSEQGLNFTGACFFGNPFPTIGHNEHLGWTYTVNEPDIADAWRVTFDNKQHPLKYRYADGYRTATEWRETLKVRNRDEVTEQQVTFRRTHHGPIVRREDENVFVAVQVAGLFDLARVDQAWGMVLADSFEKWRTAMSHCAIPMFNTVYADKAGNIFYAYNGTIPIRDPAMNWQKPVDGSNPDADWKGIHAFKDLPQVLNPSCGYVQSCNSAPFTTTHVDSDNPKRDDFPNYMIEDADVDMRRSKMSRHILSRAEDLQFDDLQELAYDTKLYWPMTEVPKLTADFEKLKRQKPDLASEVAPYWNHLKTWDCRATIECTRTTLMVAWYEELYGFGYPAETLKGPYRSNRQTWFTALKTAAKKIEGLYGSWKHPWGEAHRLQRVADQPDVQHAGVGLNPFFESLPCPGTPGPLGIICTVYSSPEIPYVRPRRYAVVGASYMAAVEFDQRIRTASIMPFGSSGRRRSPHFFDQAKLYSESRLKPAPYYDAEVKRLAEKTIYLSR